MNAGNIPVELSQLSCLYLLTLKNNNLSGDDFFNNLSFYLRQLTRAGKFPVELAMMPKLSSLDISGNKLTGIPHLVYAVMDMSRWT